jgi:lysophospholipid acyltransferase
MHKAIAAVHYRLWLMWVLGFVYRLRYYFAWKVAEAGLIFSGMSFSGYEQVCEFSPQLQSHRMHGWGVHSAPFCGVP